MAQIEPTLLVWAATLAVGGALGWRIRSRQGNRDRQELEAQLEIAIQKCIEADQRSRGLEIETERLQERICTAERAMDRQEASARQAASQAEKQARALEGLLQWSHEGIARADGQGRLLARNRAARALFGDGAPGSFDPPACQLLAPESRDTFAHAVQRILSEEGTPSLTLDLLAARTDGSFFPAEIRLVRWPSTHGAPGFALIVRDRSASRPAVAASPARGQALVHASQELRTALHALLGFSEILAEGAVGDLNPKQSRSVRHILEAGRQLLRRIDDLLDLSRSEADRMQAEYATFSPLTALRQIENLVRASLARKELTLSVDAPEDLPALTADPTQFKQILYNLVRNAIPSLPDGGHLEMRLRVLDGVSLQVTVRGTGAGIVPADPERLRQASAPIDPACFPPQPDIALGLALVQRFVALHAGRTEVRAEGDGRRPTVVVTLPLAPPTAAAVGPRRVVLVADSETAEMERLTQWAQEGGYDALRAPGLPETAALERALRPAALALDLRTAGAEDWAALTARRSDPEAHFLPVVALVAPEDRNRAFEAGATACFIGLPEREALLEALAGAGVPTPLRKAA